MAIAKIVTYTSNRLTAYTRMRKKFRKTADNSFPLLNKAVLAKTEPLSVSDFERAKFSSIRVSKLSEMKYRNGRLSPKALDCKEGGV